jgi:hypothetical protein
MVTFSTLWKNPWFLLTNLYPPLQKFNIKFATTFLKSHPARLNRARAFSRLAFVTGGASY